MITITRVEVSTNGRGHLVDSYQSEILVKDKSEFSDVRNSIKEKYTEFNKEDLTIYLSYSEM